MFLCCATASVPSLYVVFSWEPILWRLHSGYSDLLDNEFGPKQDTKLSCRDDKGDPPETLSDFVCRYVLYSLLNMQCNVIAN